MKTKSGREIVCFVAREGKVRGEGRYVGTEAGKETTADWRESRIDACRWPVDERDKADGWLPVVPSARLVAIVRPLNLTRELNAAIARFEKMMTDARPALGVPEGVSLLDWLRLQVPEDGESAETWPAMRSALVREMLRLWSANMKLTAEAAARPAATALGQRPMKHEYRSKGHRWRVQSDEKGRFDEIAVVVGREPYPKSKGDGLILHAEMMDNRSCFINVASVCLWVHVGKDGIARITHQEDRRPKATKGKKP